VEGAMIIIVLGMHRSGTSLVSSILHAMGVCMGDPIHLERRDPQSQPQGYWEDQDFVALNRQIIKAAGGHWHNPPTRESILRAARRWAPEMEALIAEKEEGVRKINEAGKALTGAPQHIGWGWKDPRSCLTMEAWWNHLADADVRFVRVRRKAPAIVDSLILRGEQLGGLPAGEQAEAWLPIISDHENRITNFFIRSGKAEASVEAHFEHLVRKDDALVPLTKIATLLGLEGEEFIEAIQRGMERIEFRG